jgi:hypothetical protein
VAANTYGRQVVEALTNKSGGSVAAGDVVIVDTTNNDAFTTTTSASFGGVIGIAQETIANNAVGRVLMAGYAALVNVPASVTRGHYLFTHTVAKQATGSASRAVGAFGQFLTGGTTPDAHLFGITDPSVTGLTDPMTTRGDVIIRNASNVTARLGRGSAGQVLTSDGTDVAYATPAGGADLVQTYSGGGSVYIPGLRGSPDVKPASPNAADDEFETLTGWTTLGTLGTSNVSDFPSHWHGKKTTAGVEVNGLYKAVPATPFTITIKITGMDLKAGFPSVGIMLLDSTPTAIREFSYNYASGTTIEVSLRRYASRTSFTSSVDAVISTQNLVFLGSTTVYLKLLVTSSSSVTFSYSFNGLIWLTPATLNAISPTITPAYMGICLCDPIGVGTTEAAIDYFRVT